MNFPKVIIVVVNYRTPVDTIRCMESVLNCQYPNWQIHLVENGSNDDSTEQIRQWAKDRLGDRFVECPPDTPYDTAVKHWKNAKVVFFESPENLGFAGGNNVALKYALYDSSWSWAWLLNNDAEMAPDALNLLIERFRDDPKIGVVGSTLLDRDPPHKLQGLAGRLCKINGRSTHILNEEDLHKIDYVIGAAFLLKRNCIEQVGLMVENYFLYYEEADYCHKIRQHGYELGVEPRSIVYHASGASSIRAMREYYYARNLLYFTWNNRKDLFIQACWYVLWTRYITRWKLREIRQAVFQGAVDFIKGHQGPRQIKSLLKSC